MTTLQKSVALSAITAAIVSGLVLSIGNWKIRQMGGDPYNLPGMPPVMERDTERDLPVHNEAGGTTVIQAVKKTEPAVVSVIISKDVPVVQQYFDRLPLNDLSPFNIQIPRYRQNGTQKQEVGGGTAFFVSADGLLMTNKHVVDDPNAEYTVFLNDGSKLTATVAGMDNANDIALLRVKGSKFPFLTFASDVPELGQSVIAIGNALGEYRNTVSVGVISGLGRSINAGTAQGGSTEHLSQILQTDAAVNQGNSGGPLLNLRGEVMGMNTAVAGDAQNIAFAIPAAELQRVLAGFQKNGRIVRTYLGLRYMPITPDVKKSNNLAYDYGVLAVRGDAVTDVAILPGSPADKAGIVENDIILEADGRKLTEDVSLAALVQAKQPGDTMTLKISHKGKEKTITVTIEEWKAR